MSKLRPVLNRDNRIAIYIQVTNPTPTSFYFNIFVGYSLMIAMTGPGENKARKIANFLLNCTEEIKMITGACGKNDVHSLSKDDLRVLNSDIAKITKVKMV